MQGNTVENLDPPDVKVTGSASEPVPAKVIKSDDLKAIGQHLDRLFMAYVSDRRLQELKWLRNLRQYLGVYDPDIEKEMSSNRSRAYPKVTRVKCISTLSRIMNLMFPGNERNWEIKASPSPDMSPDDIREAIQAAQKRDQDAGVPPPNPLTQDYVVQAVQELADKRAKDFSTVIDDQMQELGGDQSLDVIALNRKVIASGILYGIGVLRGPYVREKKSTVWQIDPTSGIPAPKQKSRYMPQYDFMPVWDFYPDLGAKTMKSMDGYFERKVMSRAQVKDLVKREDFFDDVILKYLKNFSTGNYKAQPFETELRSMGVKSNVNEQKTETTKYEILIWHGALSGNFLELAGVDVPDEDRANDIDAEVWMLGGNVIKADINPWVKLGMDVSTVHTFIFDEDDTSAIGNGLPNVMRDSQMSISAATRMMLDNAGVVCGPNLELNTTLLRPDQDLASTAAYKIWYRDDDGPTAQWPAVRNVEINSHVDELMKMIDLFMKFADLETFVGPATGGDMQKMPSEPMRTAAGASMMRGDAALPFKDIIRNFDSFTQSVIQSVVKFNQKFNKDQVEEGDYNIIARGATSLISKELRGMQVDNLAATLRPEEAMHIDERKLVEARLAVRDLTDLLVSESDVARKQQAASQQQQAQQQQQTELTEANIRKLLSDAFKNIAQGQKNSAAADAEQVQNALLILEKGLQHMGVAPQPQPQLGAPDGAAAAPPEQPQAQPPTAGPVDTGAQGLV